MDNKIEYIYIYYR